MFKKLAILASVAVAFFTASVCQAGFVVTNNSNSALQVTYVMTFGPHIYSQSKTIRPGQQFEISGGFNVERTYWLSIRRLDNGKYLTFTRTFPTALGNVDVQATTMYYFTSPDFTNAFVASQMRAGNWVPLRNTTRASGPLPCIRVHNSFSIANHGGQLIIGNGQYSMRSWR